MALWRNGRDDACLLLRIALLPLLIAAPSLLGFLISNPTMWDAGIAIGADATAVNNMTLPIGDGNTGFAEQALGYRTALELIYGHMPWWNANSGVGMPLAVEALCNVISVEHIWHTIGNSARAQGGI